MIQRSSSRCRPWNRRSCARRRFSISVGRDLRVGGKLQLELVHGSEFVRSNPAAHRTVAWKQFVQVADKERGGKKCAFRCPWERASWRGEFQQRECPRYVKVEGNREMDAAESVSLTLSSALRNVFRIAEQIQVVRVHRTSFTAPQSIAIGVSHRSWPSLVLP